jgi:hypothetical protein
MDSLTSWCGVCSDNVLNADDRQRRRRHRSTRVGHGLQGFEVIRVGEDVELLPDIGETQPRVARIEALWREHSVDGRERMLARCRMYFRPPVCACPALPALPCKPA